MPSLEVGAPSHAATAARCATRLRGAASWALKCERQKSRAAACASGGVPSPPPKRRRQSSPPSTRAKPMGHSTSPSSWMAHGSVPIPTAHTPAAASNEGQPGQHSAAPPGRAAQRAPPHTPHWPLQQKRPSSDATPGATPALLGTPTHSRAPCTAGELVEVSSAMSSISLVRGVGSGGGGGGRGGGGGGGGGATDCARRACGRGGGGGGDGDVGVVRPLSLAAVERGGREYCSSHRVSGRQPSMAPSHSIKTDPNEVATAVGGACSVAAPLPGSSGGLSPTALSSCVSCALCDPPW